MSTNWYKICRWHWFMFSLPPYLHTCLVWMSESFGSWTNGLCYQSIVFGWFQTLPMLVRYVYLFMKLYRLYSIHVHNHCFNISNFNTYTYSCICTITVGRSSKNPRNEGMSIILVDWIGSGSTSSVVKYDKDCMFLWFSHNFRTECFSNWTLIEGNDISILIYRTYSFLL